MPDSSENPYVGPRPFEPGEGERFFGRKREASEIVAMVLGHQMSVVYAQSGAGKTSLFNAKVLPDLAQEEGCVILPLLRVGGVLPEGVALDDVANIYVYRSLLQLAPEEDPEALAVPLAARLAEVDRPQQIEGQPALLVVVFDQFEELFTTGSPGGWADKENFFDQLREALADDPYLRVVLVLREDFLAQLDPLAARMPERLRVRFRLERLGRKAAVAAVEEPARVAGRPFATGAADLLVDALRRTREVIEPGKILSVGGEYVEPVQLQVVCFSLWGHLPPGDEGITAAQAEAFGDVERALTDFYEESVRELAEAAEMSEARLRRWFGDELITSTRTRAAVIEEGDVVGGIPISVARHCESLHLIRAERRAGARWYELIHDSFIEPILASNQRWQHGAGLSETQRDLAARLEAAKKAVAAMEAELERAVKTTQEQYRDSARSSPSGRSTSELRKLWSPPCAVEHYVELELHSGAVITVHRLTADVFLAVDAVMERFGYAPRPRDTGAYNCRKIVGGTNYSLHAYGIAVDYNWSTNPYGRKLVTDMSPELIDAILAIRTVGDRPALRWGGHYSRNKDAGHFEIIASPEELAAGIDPATITGP